MIRAENGDVVYLEQLKNSVESDATEKATSRKCEGQLSSVKANSCSSYKGANRTTEMAQEDNNPCWDNLPSVILQEIFSYLPHNCRLRASQVCRNWRYTLFHPRFWRKITFALKDEDSILWSQCLGENFGLSVREVTIRCDTPNHSVEEALSLLKKLSCNRQLRKLFLESSSSSFEYDDDNDDSPGYTTPLIKSLVKIIETSNRLEALSLGCIEELTASAAVLLEPLRLHHAKHLTTLSLASVRDEPDDYDFLQFDYEFVFSSFVRLSILTLDYEFITDYLLQALDNGTMERLVIHVHGWNDHYLGTTDSAWQNFIQKNPKCELRLNLIHSYVGIQMLDTDILRPSMPLTHLKVLFCENVNIRALHRLSSWYSLTLKSLIWIDSMEPRITFEPATHDPDDPDSPDPLVLVAWKCTKLVEIVFIGHKYYQENLLAIARLRGCSLKSLVFAQRYIASDNESWHMAETITHEIEEIMGRRWKLLSDADLPPVVNNAFGGDSREVIMPLVLCDQK
ncbi:F-box only protein 33 [Osmia lignaria lignaria]|uniref:F-box only protein 33 n=1 Tax=Osmia bicornis bicornis TaxID=1437191 RepID=UPI0010F9CCA9|nr:F-box only protein 33 [Osmia bicornis bicornis]XP_034176205.1 F-box only protein 33 [Osmia lignaria]